LRTESQEPRRISTLLGHAHVDMALRCLGSLLACSAEPLRLRVHDDGSLTPEDLERLAAGLGSPEVVLRTEADERLAEHLAGRPATRAFRDANPLGLKLVDVPLLAGGEVTYCDSDVLFLRPFRGLFDLPTDGAGALFMSDRQNAYSFRSWHLLAHRRLRVPCRVNTGLIRLRAGAYDPDRIEWFLERPELQRTPPWVEQTAWALLGAAAGCRLYDPAQIAIPLPGEIPGADTVALHFVSPVRSLLAGYANRPVTGGEPVAIRSVPARRCGMIRLVATELGRRRGRLRLSA
jgi:hypothetical protein